MAKRSWGPGESFLARKRYWMKALRRSLEENDAAWALHPHVREAVVELNKLPFVHTDDSAGPQILIGKTGHMEQFRNQKKTIKLAKKRGAAIFRRALIGIAFKKRHPKSLGFFSALNKWQKHHYPTARLIGDSDLVEVASPLEKPGEMSVHIHGKQIDERLEGARKFMADLHQFVRSYRLGLRKKL